MFAKMTLIPEAGGEPIVRTFDWNHTLESKTPDGEQRTVRVADISVFDDRPVIDGEVYRIAAMLSKSKPDPDQGPVDGAPDIPYEARKASITEWHPGVLKKTPYRNKQELQPHEVQRAIIVCLQAGLKVAQSLHEDEIAIVVSDDWFRQK